MSARGCNGYVSESKQLCALVSMCSQAASMAHSTPLAARRTYAIFVKGLEDKLGKLPGITVREKLGVNVCKTLQSVIKVLCVCVCVYCERDCVCVCVLVLLCGYVCTHGGKGGAIDQRANLLVKDARRAVFRKCFVPLLELDRRDCIAAQKQPRRRRKKKRAWGGGRC